MNHLANQALSAFNSDSAGTPTENRRLRRFVEINRLRLRAGLTREDIDEWHYLALSEPAVRPVGADGDLVVYRCPYSDA